MFCYYRLISTSSLLAYCVSHNLTSKGILASFGGPFPLAYTSETPHFKPTKKQTSGGEPDHGPHSVNIINLGIIPQPYSKTSRFGSLSLRLCYSKPMPPKRTLQFITHFGAIPPEKFHGENTEINEQSKKRL